MLGIGYFLIHAIEVSWVFELETTGLRFAMGKITLSLQWIIQYCTKQMEEKEILPLKP